MGWFRQPAGVAALPWNQWQLSRGMGGRLRLESVATLVWNTQSGKSGGIRAIYYWKKSDHEVWMLTLYSKSERASIPGHMLKQIAEAIKND
jgi:hypothetical protein